MFQVRAEGRARLIEEAARAHEEAMLGAEPTVDALSNLAVEITAAAAIRR
jgi:hypothetical protein